MSYDTKIEWAEATWNPYTGCRKVSPGCKNCYAETFADRWLGTNGHYFEHGFDLEYRPGMVDRPRKWAKPRTIFTCSMSDLLHGNIVNNPNEMGLFGVLDTMLSTPQHRYLILTKRSHNIPLFHSLLGDAPEHIWMGVSAEDQKHWNRRVSDLCHYWPGNAFVSVEPMLEQISIGDSSLPDWIICGGESGPGKRPMNLEWARSLRDECASFNVPFFFKQVDKVQAIPTTC